LQIAMQHAPVMSCRKSGGKLSRDIQRLFIREIADALDQRREVFSIDVLHGEEVLSFDLRDVVHATNVRMCELPRDPYFGEESFPPHRIGSQSSRKKLQRDWLA